MNIDVVKLKIQENNSNDGMSRLELIIEVFPCLRSSSITSETLRLCETSTSDPDESLDVPNLLLGK
jgi:hypothetical protein